MIRLLRAYSKPVTVLSNRVPGTLQQQYPLVSGARYLIPRIATRKPM